MSAILGADAIANLFFGFVPQRNEFEIEST
jgi:hypothetical protein